AENDRTLANGELPLNVAAGKAEELTIKLRAPEVKPGVILKTRLRVKLFEGGDTKPVATHSRPVWVFAEDPLADRREWLKGLKLNLYDPEKTTAEPLRKLEVPFEEVATVAGLADLKEGLLIVGQGVSFKDYPDLAEALTRAAAGGMPVLCLAPAGGSF